MRNWHKRLIHVPQNIKGEDIIIGIIDDGLLEFVKKNTSNIDSVLSLPNYKVAHPSFDDNIGTKETRVFFRKNDESQHLSTEQININNVINYGYVKAHLTSASGIIVGKQIDNNLVEGIVPNATLINSQEVIDAFILTNTHTYALKNSDPDTAQYYNDKIVRKNLMISKEVPSGNLTPNDVYSKKSASVINLSISWNNSGEDTPKGIGNPNQKECQFLLNEIFAYARNGRGSLIISSAGNGMPIDDIGTRVGVELTKENNFLRASNKAFMVAASSINTYNFNNNPNSYDDFNNVTEIPAQYSNYGEKTVDICAPSTPIGIIDEKSLSIYAPTKMYCGELGFENQYIELKVLNKDLQNRKLKIENTKGIFSGQSVDIGNSSNFANEIRFIEEVDRTNNIITLDKDFFFTHNIPISNVKILQLKRRGKRNPLPTEINKITLEFDEMLGKGLAREQEIYIYSESNPEKNLYTKIKNKTYPSIEVEKTLSDFSIGENLIIVPGKMSARLERTDVGKGFYKILGTSADNDISGFFNGQLIKIKYNDKNYVYDLTSINYATRNAEITLLRLPEKGEVVSIESLSYGHYTSKFGGTSAAAPIVTGVAALVLSANPQLNAAEIKHILKSTTEHIGNVTYRLQNDNTKYNYGYEVHEKFGAGRVNAEEAVRLALRWHTDNTVEKPRMCFPNKNINNPNAIHDIWISSETNAIASSSNPYNLLNTSLDHNIFIRIKNNGHVGYSFQETDLRVLVAFTNEVNPKFSFPDYWYENKIAGVDNSGNNYDATVCLLDVKEVIPIAPGTDINPPISISWKNIRTFLADKGFDASKHKLYILAHIAPFDGTDVELGIDLGTINVYTNKNLNCVEIFTTDTRVSKRLEDGTKVPLNGDKSNLIATDVEKQEKFCVDMYNVQATEIDTKQFKFSLLDKPNGAVESEVIIKKNNGNWDLSNLPNWLTADIVETDSALYAVTHKNAEINYALSYDLTKAGKQIQFAVI